MYYGMILELSTEYAGCYILLYVRYLETYRSRHVTSDQSRPTKINLDEIFSKRQQPNKLWYLDIFLFRYCRKNEYRCFFFSIFSRCWWVENVIIFRPTTWSILITALPRISGQVTSTRPHGIHEIITPDCCWPRPATKCHLCAWCVIFRSLAGAFSSREINKIPKISKIKCQNRYSMSRYQYWNISIILSVDFDHYCSWPYKSACSAY